MKQVIARIKLNPGQGGFFDPITRIHLTHGDPVRDVYAGMNTEGLKAAVRNKRISLISGSLGNNVAPFKFVRRQDGKVVIMSNKIQETVQQEETAPKIKAKAGNVSKKPKPVLKTQPSLPAEPVEKPVVETPSVTTTEETKEPDTISVVNGSATATKAADLAMTLSVPPAQEESVKQELPVIQEPVTVQESEVRPLPQEKTKEQETIVATDVPAVEDLVNVPTVDNSSSDITTVTDTPVNVSLDTTGEQESTITAGSGSSADIAPYKRYKKNKKKYNDN